MLIDIYTQKERLRLWFGGSDRAGVQGARGVLGGIGFHGDPCPLFETAEGRKAGRGRALVPADFAVVEITAGRARREEKRVRRFVRRRHDARERLGARGARGENERRGQRRDTGQGPRYAQLGSFTKSCQYRSNTFIT